MKITYCEDCQHVANPKDNWFKWGCLMFPRLEGIGYVTKSYRETDPYMRCRDINGGACPMYKKKGEEK